MGRRGPWIGIALGMLVAMGALGVPAAAVLGPLPAPEGPLPTGTLLPSGELDDGCPDGAVCLGFTVDCDGLQRDARGFLALYPPLALPRGLLMFFSGGGGTTYWAKDSPAAAALLEDLQGLGYTLAQVRWVDPWLRSEPGEDAGPAKLACRPATVVRFGHDNLLVDLNLEGGAGRCGFCLTGNSGGASQVSYAIAHYGLGDLPVNAIVPTGGPPHAALAKGCLRSQGEEAYWFEPGSAATIDGSFGFAAGKGPCARHDAAFEGRWLAEAVDTGAFTGFYPLTRVHLLLGAQDGTVAPAHGRDFAAMAQAQGSPSVTVQVMPGVGHSIVASQAGLDAVRAALLQPPAP